MKNFEETYCLYRAVDEGGEWGSYEGSSNDKGQKFIKGPVEPSLELLSENAIYQFKKVIRDRYMDGDGEEEMNPEGWYNFKRAMAKED